MTNFPSLLVHSTDSHDNTLRLIANSSGEYTHSNEIADRVIAIHEGLSRNSKVAFEANNDPVHDEELTSILNSVHDFEYIHALKSAARKSKAERNNMAKKYAAIGVTPDTPLEQNSYQWAESAAIQCIHSARSIINKSTHHSYALCRPPGRHAGRQFFGGYCFLNNAAVAASTLIRNSCGPVGVLDIDFHVGNGTSDCLSEFRNISFASCHASTETSFPFVSNLVPVDPKHKYISFQTRPRAREWIDAIIECLRHLKNVGAKFLVVSLGYDVIEGDPHGRWTLAPSVFHQVGIILSKTNLPLCIVQEGGYYISALSSCAEHFVAGLVGNHGKNSHAKY